MKFWTVVKDEVEVVPQPCPTRNCRNTVKPKEVKYQFGTNEPAVIWDCGRHRFFACRVQNWLPVARMGIRV